MLYETTTITDHLPCNTAATSTPVSPIFRADMVAVKQHADGQAPARRRRPFRHQAGHRRLNPRSGSAAALRTGPVRAVALGCLCCWSASRCQAAAAAPAPGPGPESVPSAPASTLNEPPRQHLDGFHRRVTVCTSVGRPHTGTVHERLDATEHQGNNNLQRLRRIYCLHRNCVPEEWRLNRECWGPLRSKTPTRTQI